MTQTATEVDRASPKPTLPSPVQGILRRRGSQSPNNRRSGVHFEAPPNLAEILVKYDAGENNLAELEGFITHMRNQQGQALVGWMQVLHENIALMKPKLEHFVLAILRIPWACQESGAVGAFKMFLVNLITAHSYYTKPVAQMLLRNMVGKAPRNADEEAKEAAIFENSHDVLKTMLEVAPLGSKQAILTYAKESFPYMLIKNPDAHTKYIANLVKVADSMPASERLTVLKLVIERLVQLDAYLPKLDEYEEDEDEEEDDDDDDEEDVFPMEGAETAEKIPKQQPKVAPVINQHSTDVEVARANLDLAMKVMFEYVGRRVASGSAAELYQELLAAFESLILPTYATGHVQYLLFYFLSLDKSGKSTAIFLDWLWRKFQNPNTPGIIRQSTVAYIASLLARAKQIDIDMAQMCLAKLVGWIHSYIEARESGGSKDYMFTDIKSHGPFYAATQSALYIFAFRHQEFVASEARLKFLQSLNLGTIIHSHLNPLRVCLPPVVKNFAAIARHYQLVYCDTVIERNKRINLPVVGGLSALGSAAGKPLLLDSFFPFDPYMLTASAEYVKKDYRVYEGKALGGEDDDEDMSESEEESEDEEEEEGEEMEVSKTPSMGKSLLANFVYGTSPGFKV